MSSLPRQRKPRTNVNLPPASLWPPRRVYPGAPPSPVQRSRSLPLRLLAVWAALTGAAVLLSGCVVAPAPHGYAPGYYYPSGQVVYVEPVYPAPGPGWAWEFQAGWGWGWHHPHRGWSRGRR
ncbi:MAG: hypothetical protein RIQ60_4007 [Pseudomonadota bacterium]|jgi:hypothetical protein